VQQALSSREQNPENEREDEIAMMVRAQKWSNYKNTTKFLIAITPKDLLPSFQKDGVVE